MTKTNPALPVTGLLPRHERPTFDSIVHGLRQQGWSKFDAEAEAIDRIDRTRQALAQAKGDA